MRRTPRALRPGSLHVAVAFAITLLAAVLAPEAHAEDAAAAAGSTAAATAEATPTVAQAVWAVLFVLGVGIGVVGVGCALAVLGAVFPSLTTAVDRQARLGSSAAQGLLGSLAVTGVLLAIAGVARLGSPTAAGLVGLGLGGPALLLAIAGSLGTVPLLGERILGARGPAASPLRRAVVGSVALALAFVPGLAFRFYPLALLLGVPLLGWPLGVAMAAWLGRGRRPGTLIPAATGGTPPTGATSPAAAIGAAPDA